MRDPYIQTMTNGFEDELRKIAGAASEGGGLMKTLMRKEVMLPVAGAIGYKTLSQAEHDRRMGRQIRKQQGY